MLALELLLKTAEHEIGNDEDNEAVRKKNIVSIVETVADRLGNTPAVCQMRCYIHPAIFRAYLDGTLTSVLSAQTAAGHSCALHAAEMMLQRFLRQLPVGAGG